MYDFDFDLRDVGPMPATRSNTAGYAAGIGMMLVGGFFLFHLINQYRVRRKMEEMGKLAAAGQIPTKDFLNFVLSTGQAVDPGTGEIVRIDEAKRLPCSQIFAFDGASFLPGFQEALAKMRADGTCL
jgi:hypothetical protein